MGVKPAVLAIILAIILVLAGCTNPGATTNTTPSSTGPGNTSPVSTSSPTITPTTSIATISPTRTPSVSPSVIPPPTITGTPVPTTSDFVTGLQAPWEMAFAPDSRIFLTERPGRIRVIRDGQLQSQPWMTLNVAAVGEGGLLGLALDPDFSDNGYVYVAYTYRSASGSLHNKVVRLKEDTVTQTGREDMVVFDDSRGNSIHDGGRVKFGPDGKLYYSIGDAGNADGAQDLSVFNGKVLRLNPDGTIPVDNPFPGSPVFSYGNRNPEGLAFQPGTGRLYETEHGSSATDEVNFIEAGLNYGWPVVRGDQTQAGMVSPIRHSGSDTWAPSGATFVSGGLWDGSLLFAGLRGESLFRVVLDPSDPRKVLSFERHFQGQFGRLRDVAQGPDGTIYILTNNTDGRGSPRAGDDRILKLEFR